MPGNKLPDKVTHKTNTLRTLLTQKQYLFLDKAAVEMVPSRSGAQCTIYIPRYERSLGLIDGLGSISGELIYRLDSNGDPELFRYSLGFVHAKTYVEYYEDEGLGKERYKFHYDMDKDNAKPIVHPLSHMQIHPLSMPRFEATLYDNEVVMVKAFLDLIEQSFYDNDNPGDKRKPKLKRRHVFLTQYQ